MIYLIDGDTFTGKTTYLRKYMKEHPQKSSRYMTDEEWTDILVACAHESDSEEKLIDMLINKLCRFDIVCIDNIDFISGKHAMQEITAKTILILNNRIEFFLSGINLKRKLTTMFNVFEVQGASVISVNYNE